LGAHCRQLLGADIADAIAGASHYNH
jgi:hypothetical protein